MSDADSRVSRRIFLKLLGTGAVISVGTLFGLTNLLPAGNRIGRKEHEASAALSGSWANGINTVDVGIHAALLNGGKVFYLAGSGFHVPQSEGPFKHAIWDPSTNTQTSFTLNEDLFCVGMATLPNGNILLAGGTLSYDTDPDNLNGKFHGLQSAYEVDFDSGNTTKVASMAAGRWYPTCVTIDNGNVVTVQGWDEYGSNNRLVEIYNSSSKSWSIKLDPNNSLTYCVGNGAEDVYPEAGSPCFGPGVAPFLTLYPRMHFMPTGLIIACGMGNTDRVYDPSTGRWYFGGNAAVRHYGTSVLLPLQNNTSEKGKILVCGGSPAAGSNAVASAEIITPSGTTGVSHRSVQSMKYARKHMNPVIMPTGEVVIFGGNSLKSELSSAVNAPESFDPVTETWSELPAASVPRLYHSVALLLKDGRVWTASTTVNAYTKELRTEIFTPNFISETRPTILALTGGAYGNTITIATPDAASITKVSLLRASSTTHHYNTDQRLIWLGIKSKTASTVTVDAPINSKLAPPGQYLIHVINTANVPSVGEFIKIPGTVDTGGGGGSGTFQSLYSVIGTNSYLKLYSGSLHRAGELLTSSSSLIGQSVKRVTVVLKKSGNPSGTVNIVVRNGSGDSMGLTLGSLQASALTTSDQSFTVTASSSHTFAANDKVLVEWEGTGNSTDQVWVKRRYSTDAASGFDGSNTRQVHKFAANAGYSNHAGSDLAGEWFKEV